MDLKNAPKWEAVKIRTSSQSEKNHFGQKNIQLVTGVSRNVHTLD